jgi:TonB-dependent receptor
MSFIKRAWKYTIGWLLLSLLLISLPAFAQSGKGSLSGRVADAADAILPGAEVVLIPSAGHIVTNSQGEFTVTNLAPGSYEVHINYVGFEPFSQSVTITAGKTTQLRAVIKVQGRSEEVTVYSERQSGEAEAINRTRAAENILQVLPAEVITSLPNANIADALGRMPSVTIERDEGEGKYVQIRGTEPRLSNTMIDGITIPSPENGVRQIKLDTIASDLVESVEINKTLQANIDADGIGGSVNLRTKTAGETPTVSLYGIGGYTPILTGRDVYQGGGTLGKRFGEQKKFGVLFGGTSDYNGRGINDIEPSPTAGSATPHYDSMDMRDYVYNRTRYGFAGSMDYKLREGSSVYMRGLYSTFRNWGNKWTITLNDYDTPKFKQDWRRPDMAIANIVTGGKHVFNSSWFTWDLSAGRSRSLGGGSGNGDAGFKWANGKAIASSCYNVPGVSVNRPGWSAGCFTPGAGDAANEDNYNLTSFNLPGQGISAQLNLQGSASYAKNYQWGSHFGTFETGFKVRNAHKFDDSFDLQLNQPNGPEPVASHPEWASDFRDNNYYDGSYPNKHFGSNLADWSKIRTWALQQPGGWNIANGNGQFNYTPGMSTLNTVNYDLVERVTAGYVMNTVDLNSRMRLVAGLRIENTHVNTLSYGQDSIGNLIPTTVNNSYLDALPSASLRIALDKDSNLRLVYGRGLARPDPEMITAALADTGSTLGSNEILTEGNTKLKAEYADNFDILYERYFKPVGMFQAGYFYKAISDPIIQTIVPATNAPANVSQNCPCVYEQYQNAQSAHVQGIEFGFQQHLSYLPGPMRFLGISANYSYTQSQLNGFKDPTTGIAYRTDKPAMLRQAPNSWNISPTFDTKKFSMRIGMSYNGSFIYAYQWYTGADQAGSLGAAGTTIGPKGPAGDQYMYSHYQLDLQASYNLPYGLQAYGYVLNINNEVFGFYNGSPRYVDQREYYHPTFAGGLRYNLTREHN